MDERVWPQDEELVNALQALTHSGCPRTSDAVWYAKAIMSLLYGSCQIVSVIRFIRRKDPLEVLTVITSKGSLRVSWLKLII